MNFFDLIMQVTQDKQINIETIYGIEYHIKVKTV